MTDFRKSRDQISVAPDQVLLDMLDKGNEAALTELYERYWESVFLYVARVLRDTDEAGDVVQETFIALWQKQGELRSVYSLKAYLIGIARFKALRRIHAHLSEERYRTSLLSFFTDQNPSPESDLIASETETLLEMRIGRLPERMREVFLLSRRDHLTYAQIAAKLGISDKTVKKQIHNALKHLRGALDEQQMLTVALFCAILEG